MRYLRSENNKTCYERQHMLKYLLGQHLVPLLMHQYSSIDLSSKISPGSKEADLRFVGDITVRFVFFINYENFYFSNCSQVQLGYCNCISGCFSI